MMWRIILSIVLITTFIAVAALSVKRVMAMEDVRHKAALEVKIQ
jgi:hypothetical protein